jgi:hypothetical protein
MQLQVEGPYPGDVLRSAAMLPGLQTRQHRRTLRFGLHPSEQIRCATNEWMVECRHAWIESVEQLDSNRHLGASVVRWSDVFEDP